MWFERYHFTEDPYTIRDPFRTSPDRIQWDRDDLPQKDNLRLFVEDVKNGSRVGLRVYGPAGSGKTWLLRYLEKELHAKLGDKIAILYGKVIALDPTFSALYDTLVQDWYQRHRKKVLETVGAKAEAKTWEAVIEDADLRACLQIFYYPRRPGEEYQKRVCEHWLRGSKIQARDLADVGIMSSLDSDYQRYLTLRELLRLTLLAYQGCVLMIDELENAPARVARPLGDSFRDLLDSFSEGFALACGYTAQAADELLDLGYGEFLFTRLQYDVRLDPITPEWAPKIFRIHHKAYRDKTYTGDELLPFTEGSLGNLIRRIEPLRWYPRQILVNCGALSRMASEEEVDVIDENFVDRKTAERPQHFQYLTSQPRLT